MLLTKLFPLLSLCSQILVQLAFAQSNISLPTEDFEWPSQFVRSGPSILRVLVQGTGPTVLILPSYGRDGGDDFNHFSSALVQAGYLVLRPQPRGIMGSTGPMQNITMDDLAADVAQVIDTLGGGQAIVLGHAFGAFVTKIVAFNYPEKVPAIIVAAGAGQQIPSNIGIQPFIAGNTSAPISTRLASLSLAFFAPNHDPHIWLNGWYPDTLAMEHVAMSTFGSFIPYWAGANTTQVLEIIPADDPFQPMDQWNTTTDLYPDRAVSVIIQDSSHALFVEQGQQVVDAVLPWLAEQSSKLG